MWHEREFNQSHKKAGPPTEVGCPALLCSKLRLEAHAAAELQ
jgi:hypothetical protein